MQGFSAPQGGVRVHGLVDLGERVEEAPGVSGLERFMLRLAPLHENIRDLGRSNRRAIHCADDDVMRPRVGYLFFLVGKNPLVQRPELVTELADSTSRQVPEVTFRKSGVLAADPHLPAEAEVVANKNACSSHESGRIRHVMAVADANDPSEVRLTTVRQCDGHHTEVSGSVMAESMGFLCDGEPAGNQLGFDLGEDRAVVERVPCAGSQWCRHGKEILAADGLGSAVEKHSSRGSLNAGLRVFYDVHGIVGVETTKAGDVFRLQPSLCLVCPLHPHALERADFLADVVDLLNRWRSTVAVPS